MTAVKCPGCGKVKIWVTDMVKEYIDPKFHCTCGRKGKLVWRRKEKE